MENKFNDMFSLWVKEDKINFKNHLHVSDQFSLFKIRPHFLNS